MPVTYLKETPSQTAGPYLHIGMLPAQAGLPIRTQEKLNIMAGAGVDGERIRIEGIVFDGSGNPVFDAQIEAWQANSKGQYNAKGFRGWGRAGADFKTGEWFFETIKPGTTKWRDGRPQAPHISLLVFARGINVHLHTRLYFEDEEKANEADPVLKFIEIAPLRKTLIAKKLKKGKTVTYRLEIHLQGDQETVFFDM